MKRQRQLEGWLLCWYEPGLGGRWRKGREGEVGDAVWAR